ncbi:MAG: methyltransferase domain-containing protein [Gammaproteobacteria bacterium]|jgi:SAM-dependent methyltransferase
MSSSHDVERYYDRNTRRFLTFGGGASTHAIHRLLWGPGVTDVAGAAGHINYLLEEAIETQAAEPFPVLIDLGCGVGGTLLHLARALPNARLHGVTISRRQVEIAERATDDAGVGDRVEFHCADFESLELDLAADTVIAIESFTHSHATDDFFAVTSRHLKPGGILIIVDDFTTRRDDNLAPAEQRLARDFRAGWRVPGLCTTSECIAVAARHGLEVTGERNLTGLIRLRRPRDRLIGLIAPPAARLGLARLPFFGNLIGGNALHAGLVAGLFEYRWLSFRRAPRRHPD